jgi:hypothetical protein
MWPLDSTTKTATATPDVASASGAGPSPQHHSPGASPEPFALPLPAEITGWNWGAFWLSWIWGIRHRVWVSLLVFIPVFGLIWHFVLGAKGTEWAWETERWKSVEAFRRTQRRWSIAGFVVAGLLLVLLILAALGSPGSATTAGTADASAVPVLAQGGSFDVAGTRIVCRAASGDTVVVDCGPIGSDGAALPDGLRGRISSRSVAVLRLRRGRAARVFTRPQPQDAASALAPAASTAPHISLGRDEVLAVDGTGIVCAALEDGLLRGVVCTQSRDRLGNELMPGHLALIVTSRVVAVTRITNPAGDQTLGFERAQSRALGQKQVT